MEILPHAPFPGSTERPHRPGEQLVECVYAMGMGVCTGDPRVHRWG